MLELSIITSSKLHCRMWISTNINQYLARYAVLTFLYLCGNVLFSMVTGLAPRFTLLSLSSRFSRSCNKRDMFHCMYK